MNPSTVLASVVVDELVRGGVREAVLAPGSRSAPLAFALHAADRAGRLRLHVRIDERTAGFLALGLAKASGRPVPVVTTSGTAAVNLHPAVVEASYAGVPLVALTADRPEELRGVGANQTIDQVRLFGHDVVSFVEVTADEPSDREAAWRAVVADALAAARSGPVHINVAFREPLVPDEPLGPDEPLVPDERLRMQPRAAAGEAPGRPVADEDPLLLEAGPRTVVVAGDGAGWGARRLAEAAGWPLLAEPSSGARSGPNALGCYRLLLDELGRDIERVVLFGRPTLSRPVARLLNRPDLELVVVRQGKPRAEFRRRASSTAAAVAPARVDRDAGASRSGSDSWLAGWLDADAAARKAVAEVVGQTLCGPAVAAAVAAAVPPGALLVAGSSASIRDLDLANPWDDPEGDRDQHRLVLANRGASGIDGTVSTAIGAALAHAHGHAYALLGDLTFLHDSTGLVIGPEEPRPDLTIVINSDDGGGIFSVLEQGAEPFAEAFERVFGTPHGVDMAALCAATRTPYALASTHDELQVALAPRPGIAVVEVRTDRHERRALDRRLRDAVIEALRA